MKIAFVQDICPAEMVGGAQANDWNVIKKGLERRHDIRIITPENFNLFNLEGTDLVIFSNIMKFPSQIIKNIATVYPYMFFHHDYNFYQYRLFYHGKSCDDTGINREFWGPLYNNAKLHIWLSPFHRNMYLIAFPELQKFFDPEEPNDMCIPSCLDVDMWRPVEGVERKKGTVIAVNSLEEFKGRENIIKYVEEHPELNFTFVGSADTIPYSNCTFLPRIRNEDLPALYSAHEYFIHLPNNEPFGRVSMEALLCGCKIITNENNGAFSFPKLEYNNIENLRNQLRYASLAFWETVEIKMGWLKLE